MKTLAIPFLLVLCVVSSASADIIHYVGDPTDLRISEIHGLNIGGTDYNVTFQRNENFSDVTNQGISAFTTAGSAFTAMEAVLTAINGLSSTESSFFFDNYLYIPYSTTGLPTGDVSFFEAIENTSDAFNDYVITGPETTPDDFPFASVVGGDAILTFVVPEPSTFSILGLGLAFGAVARRRRQRNV